MIDIYGAPNSRSTRILWCAEELGVEYRFVKIDFGSGENKSKAYLSINPSGKTPALVQGEFKLSESAAILKFLVNEYSSGQIKPTNNSSSEEEAICDKWCYFAVIELEQPLWTLAKHSFIYPEEMREAKILPICRQEFQDSLLFLSQELCDKKYIMGDDFSIADILISHTLAWALSFQQDISHSNIVSYIERCTNRPALTRAKKREKMLFGGI
ncbi:glutathione S-transferase family protein [Vibrio parahaemolyticus]